MARRASLSASHLILRRVSARLILCASHRKRLAARAVAASPIWRRLAGQMAQRRMQRWPQLKRPSERDMPALSWRTEYACLNAWPSLSNVIHDGWMVRLADGLTRRANSVNPLHAGARITPENLRFFEALFDDRDLP